MLVEEAEGVNADMHEVVVATAHEEFENQAVERARQQRWSVRQGTQPSSCPPTAFQSVSHPLCLHTVSAETERQSLVVSGGCARRLSRPHSAVWPDRSLGEASRPSWPDPACVSRTGTRSHR